MTQANSRSTVYMVALMLAAGLASPAARSEGALNFSGSGFLTLAAGKVLSGTANAASDAGFRCPCFIADYAEAGVYETGGWQGGPDTKLGLQGTVASADGRLAITAQAVARGSRNGRVDLDWLYGTAELDSHWTVQVGRKRLPLFAYSEVQDVGYAFPWVHLPPQAYGWEIVNYNGANAAYRDQWGAVSVQVNAFAGSEKLTDSPFQKVYFGKDYRADTRWPGIRGLEAKIAQGGFELRGVFIRSGAQTKFVSDGATEFTPSATQKIHGLSASYDDMRWVVRAETLYIDRRHEYGADRSNLIALGHRWGPWLAMGTFSRYRQDTWVSGGPAEGHDMSSWLLRRELSADSAVKLQFDDWRDRSTSDFSSPHGQRRLLSVAYVRVF